MTIVLDASIAAAWALADEDNEKANVTLERVRRDGAITPALFFFEIRNLLVVAERRKRTSPEKSDAFLVALRRLPVETDSTPEEGRLLALARKHGLTVYDAAYLELSLRKRLDLVTIDAKLEAASQAEGVTPKPSA
jgi:predicted nucleic acid-binding protein